VNRAFAAYPGLQTLAKPFTTDQLLDALEAVLCGKRQPARPGSWLSRLLGWLIPTKRP
jgi:hypothetical protein